MNLCTSTRRKVVKPYGTTWIFGQPECGAPATHVRKTAKDSGASGWEVYHCEEHAGEGFVAIVDEEPAEVVEVDAPQTSCPALAEPGNIHLTTAGCVECDAFRLSKMSRGAVEEHYQTGRIGQVEFEAYMFVWATSTTRHSAGGWAEEPTDPEVVEIVAAIRRHAGIPAPAELAA